MNSVIQCVFKKTTQNYYFLENLPSTTSYGFGVQVLFSLVQLPKRQSVIEALNKKKLRSYYTVQGIHRKLNKSHHLMIIIETATLLIR